MTTGDPHEMPFLLRLGILAFAYNFGGAIIAGIHAALTVSIASKMRRQDLIFPRYTQRLIICCLVLVAGDLLFFFSLLYSKVFNSGKPWGVSVPLICALIIPLLDIFIMMGSSNPSFRRQIRRFSLSKRLYVVGMEDF